MSIARGTFSYYYCKSAQANAEKKNCFFQRRNIVRVSTAFKSNIFDIRQRRPPITDL